MMRMVLGLGAAAVGFGGVALAVGSGAVGSEVSGPTTSMVVDGTVIPLPEAAPAGAASCAVTGFLADGSTNARFVPPGRVVLLEAAEASLVAVMARDASGALVTTDQSVSAWGRLRHDDGFAAALGEPVGPGAVFTSGVLKNPGPAAVTAIVATDTGVAEIDLKPGEGVGIGSGADVSAVLSSTHEQVCACECQHDGATEYPARLPCCPLPSGDGAPPVTTTGPCDCRAGDRCSSRDENGDIIPGGTIANCSAEWYPKPEDDTGTGD